MLSIHDKKKNEEDKFLPDTGGACVRRGHRRYTARAVTSLNKILPGAQCRHRGRARMKRQEDMTCVHARRPCFSHYTPRVQYSHIRAHRCEPAPHCSEPRYIRSLHMCRYACSYDESSTARASPCTSEPYVNSLTRPRTLSICGLTCTAVFCAASAPPRWR